MKYTAFGLNLDEYLDIADRTKQSRLGLEHYKANAEWLEAKFEELGAEWLIVGGTSGTIYKYGVLNDFPTDSDIWEVGFTTGEVPFSWTIQTPIEEYPHV